jgi:hypothetical protein
MIEVRMVNFTMSLLRFFFLGDVWGWNMEKYKK